MKPPRRIFASHPRRWRDYTYVYPVISRRSRGLSIGVNLNPDAACNFKCVYCCVDHTQDRPIRHVDLDVLEGELREMVAGREQLYEEPEFRDVPASFRRLNDIAFSGDGEPTAVPIFPQAVSLAVSVRREFGLTETKIILITNAYGLARPAVAGALAVLAENNGEIWAKLDAGTEEYFRRVNRASVTLRRVLDNILAAARLRPLVIQSLFLRLDGEPTPESEIEAYLGRLRWLLDGGAQISLVQVYTVARTTMEKNVGPLTLHELQAIADRVRALGLAVAVFP